jgi:hypothetical protein
MCIAARGFRGNLGDPVISTDFFGGVWVAAFNDTLALRCCVGDRTGAKQPAQPWYRQAKQNQARRDGWQEVLASEQYL